MSTPPSIKTIFQRNISLYTKSFPQEPEPIGTPDHSGTHWNSLSFRNPLELLIIQEPIGTLDHSGTHWNSGSFRIPFLTPDHSGTHWNSGSFRNPLELLIIQESIGTPDHLGTHLEPEPLRNLLWALNLLETHSEPWTLNSSGTN